MAGHEHHVARCTECGAALAAGQRKCWLCERKLTEADIENPYASPRPVAGELTAAQSSLTSFLLVIALVVVCAGLIAIAPGLGVLVAFVSGPALIRTTIAAGYRRQAGAAPTMGEKVGIFLISWFITGAIGVAIFVAFATVCAAGALFTGAVTNDMGAMLLVGGLGGLIAALPTAFWLFKISGPTKPLATGPRE